MCLSQYSDYYYKTAYHCNDTQNQANNIAPPGFLVKSFRLLWSVVFVCLCRLCGCVCVCVCVCL